MSRIKKSLCEPDQESMLMKERWGGKDRGLVTCWEVGRRTRRKNQELAEKAEQGELPVLLWKGGLRDDLKLTEKFGTLHYLAQWQGLAGLDLDIDLDEEITKKCTRTGIMVTFTMDAEKYLNT